MMAPSDSIATDTGQYETDEDLFDQGFPDHEIRKQAFFKLVTEQMNKARKVLDCRDLRVATRYRSGLNAVTTFDKVTLDVSSNQKQGKGDNGAEQVDSTSGNCDSFIDEKLKLKTPAKDEKAKEAKDVDDRKLPSHIPLQPKEKRDGNRDPLKDGDDEYQLKLVKVLNYLLAELGLHPISIIVGPDKMSGERSKTNRRMPWTMTQQPDHVDADADETVELAPSSEEESSGDDLEELSVTGGGGDFIPDQSWPGAISIVFFFLVMILLCTMLDYFAAYLDAVEWPWCHWDRLLNLSLLHNFIRYTVPNPWGMWRVQTIC